MKKKRQRIAQKKVAEVMQEFKEHELNSVHVQIIIPNTKQVITID